ncbi:MAG: nitronate monooxygenase [Gemmatimonadetes bacterium]|nr:nitronate monooxygenase [Gemmatimonadota bacterium]
MNLDTPFTRHSGVSVPIIGGPMFPCSNPELVGAVSAAGGLGVLQPISLTYIHGHEYRAGVRLIKQLAGGRPFGMNALIEASSSTYHQRMVRWVNIALEEGVRFFVTSLGNPRWVVDAVTPHGGVVYHDVTERKWADKGRDAGVHGLIAVNARAGGHSGSRSPEALYQELAPLGLPLVCAGGVGSADEFVAALRLGYAAVQMGTRFIATPECTASPAYQQAIVAATERDIVHTERLSGVPLAVIATPYVRRVGTSVGPLARWLFRGRRTKRLIRTWYALKAAWALKRSATGRGRFADDPDRAIWQAGMSVASIRAIEPVATIVRQFTDAARQAPPP